MTNPSAHLQISPDEQGATKRYVCVHGHFYQPPRENPWLETVEAQDSASPYHDWNDRITAECYAPNGASRIQNLENEIIRIVNNYSRMSFNFGPTLLSWLQEKAPRAYRTILDADKASMKRYGGHGSAMAQVYNHIIMPLATQRDALTQIRWGIADFVHRFHRRPEGMWLAETAANRKTLDLLAREGIKFTVLAPNQCARVRRMSVPEDTKALLADQSDWIGTSNSTVNPTHPYRVVLDQGRSISVFFYDGPGSRAIAFEGLLNSGDTFARRLLSGFHADDVGGTEQAQLSHVATDGESYGHHHKHGEMALSYAMHFIEEQGHARLTNYGEFLDLHPPQWQAEIAEDTSWSCSHGVERWRSNCGCNGGKPGFNQMWRGPLRRALDYLRDATAPLAEALAKPYLHDLWAARDAYIEVVLDRSTSSTDKFFSKHAIRHLKSDERILVFELLELERHTQLMYTSCGWFFDEISGIETIQIIAYAGRVLQLAEKLFGLPGAALEAEFLTLLAEAKSNVSDLGDGAQIYRKQIQGTRIELEQVGAHYAISSVFRTYPEDGELFCFDVHRDVQEVFTSGRGKVSLGRAKIRSRVTEETQQICFAVLHLGDQNLSAAVKRTDSSNPADAEAYELFTAEVRTAIRRANLPEIIRLIDRYFGDLAYSLTSLFADEQHTILRTILDQTLSEMENSLRTIYEDHASLLHFLSETGMPAPPALALAASFAINASLRRAFEAADFNAAEIAGLFNRAQTDMVKLDRPTLDFAASQRLKRAMVQLETALSTHIGQKAALIRTLNLVNSIRSMPLEVNLWQSQNIWNDMLRRPDAVHWSKEWKEGFRKLGESLNIAVDQLVVEEGVPTF